ncbi:SAV_6107 family HEPN domain-containing protein [Amycolatopsis kentuckyensis]|uniref:SAV_6107 family HEPN domain-containing protein n=1 Tax=Amycolatopsis kentuckyensis TaxID=218823 RepID=UPI00356A0052
MSVKVVSPTESGQPQLPMSLRPHTGRSPLRPSVSSAPPVPGCVEPRKPRRRSVDAGQPELPMTPEPVRPPAAPVAGAEAAEPRIEPSRPAAAPELPRLPAAGAEARLPDSDLPAGAGSAPEQPRSTESRPSATGSAKPELSMSVRQPAAAAEPSSRPAAAPELPLRPPAADGDREQSQLPMSLRPPAPPVAAGLLAQARRGLAEAERETDSVERFVGAYLAALRGAAAVLAARGRPHRGRARPASTWVLLDSVAPELREWSAFFASNSAARAAAQAGITGKVTAESADGLVHAATPFLELVRRLVHGLPITGEAHVA